MVDSLKRFLVLGIVAALFGLAGCASSGGKDGNSYFDDAAITMRVKKAIYNEPNLKVMDVSVTTVNGVVELSGSVKSRGEKVKVGNVARKVEGVKMVKNELVVQ